jgi:hypothetical protein
MGDEGHKNGYGTYEERKEGVAAAGIGRNTLVEKSFGKIMAGYINNTTARTKLSLSGR